MTTFDKASYDCQGKGEYTWVRIPAVGFELQVRHEEYGSGSRTPSVATAFVASETGSAVVEYSLRSGVYALYADGAPWAAGQSLAGVAIQLAGGGVTVTFSSGATVQANQFLANVLTVTCFVPFLYSPDIRGMLGNYNGDPADDFEVNQLGGCARWTVRDA